MPQRNIAHSVLHKLLCKSPKPCVNSQSLVQINRYEALETLNVIDRTNISYEKKNTNEQEKLILIMIHFLSMLFLIIDIKLLTI